MRERVLLSGATTMRVGGPARYFYVAKNIKDLQDILLFAKNASLPVFILGGGSNIVVSDEGFDGVVIRPDIKEVRIEETDGEHVAVLGAGEEWDACVEKITAKHIFGVENLSAIPGTVGAAPVQNIGAYGTELKEYVASVEALDARSGEIMHIPREACRFGYRDSIFKHAEGAHLIITRVTLRFPKEQKAALTYKDIVEYISARAIDETTLSPEDIRRMIIAIRAHKLPDVRSVGTVGSFFKNPVISKEKFLALSHIYKGLHGYEREDGTVKIPLAWVIEHICKKKGLRKNAVGVHDEHALVLVNYGGGTAQEIKELADEIKNDIMRHTGIEVHNEISFVGRF